MGINEVLSKNFEIADQKLVDLMDLQYVTANTDDDGTVNDVTVPAGVKGNDADALEEAAMQDGAKGGEGWYGKNGDGSWSRKDNMLGTYEMQYDMKSITDVTGSMTTGITKQAEGVKLINSTFQKLS